MDPVNLFEFIGIMIGDGCLLYYPEYGIYGIEITGNAIEERDYYERIREFIIREFHLKPRVYVKHLKNGDGLKLIVYSKKLAEKVMSYGITRNKTFTIMISQEMLSWDKSKHILRGILETDGCLYFSKSKTSLGKPSYPRLEIKTASDRLARQIEVLLRENGF